MTNLNSLTLAATIPVAALNADVTLDSIVQGSDITTNNVSSSKHGLCPKLPADATKYLDGTGAYTVPAGGGGGVTVLAYVEFTSDVSVTSTSEGSPNDVVSAGAVTFDGTSLVCVEFYAPAVTAPNGQAIILNLWEDTTAKGRISVSQDSAGVGVQGLLVRRYYTPASGSKTLKVRGWVGAGTGTVSVGAGGTTSRMPGYIRLTTGG